ncbi:MAG: hypothetical protein HC897_14115 [Thermoanaerobaculia bacterium]|nr:hypothetical protein [Thermoanaerobaculia bacterium]
MMWSKLFQFFKQQAGQGDYLVFAPEILHPGINYARLFPDPNGTLVEETDRWQQTLLYCDLIQHFFNSV